MEKILDEVRRDAIEKLKTADTEDLHLLTDAAAYACSLTKIEQLYGLSAVKQAVGDSQSEFFRFICKFISEPFEADDAIQLITNEYWSRNPQGVQAMTAYIYIRTALCIPDPEHPFPGEFRFLLQSLVPPGSLRREFEEKTGKIDREIESRHERKISESFSHIIWPEFQDAETLEDIRALESVLDRLPDRDIQRLIRVMDIDTISACICAFSENMQNRVIQNLSRRGGTKIKEVAIQLHPINEKIASQSMANMLLVLRRLEASGEIRIL